MTYVFLGGLTEAPIVGRLTQFGQRFEVTPEQAKEFIERNGGIPAIPADRFDSVGFTEPELKKYPSAASHWRQETMPDGTTKVISAPPEFLEKKKRALEILHEIRQPSGEEK